MTEGNYSNNNVTVKQTYKEKWSELHIRLIQKANTRNNAAQELKRRPDDEYDKIQVIQLEATVCMIEDILDLMSVMEREQ
jgi:hypothetical protein